MQLSGATQWPLRPNALIAKSRARREQGVSLIEALVALLVLALGILGLAGLQTQTMVDSKNSNGRAVAVRMIEDFNERMQNNRAVRIASPQPNPHPYVVNWGSPAVATTNCMTTTCTGVQLAAFDINQWKTALANVMPGGDARVFQLPNDTQQFGVIVGWQEGSDKGEGNATGTELGIYTSTFAIPVNSTTTFSLPAGLTGTACPASYQCHLVYVRP